MRGSPSSPLRPLTEELPLLLASGSPRRREILTTLGIPIRVRAVDVDETALPGERPEDYLRRIVTTKLEAASAEGVGAVLVADTTVIEGGVILGKPASAEEAEQTITRLSGRSHEVATRFAIGAPGTPSIELHAETVTTRVTFRSLSSEQVRRYVATGEGTDKAGAYAIQGRGAALASRIEGSYSNVVGLPACEVAVALERLGLWA